jgi:6-pyruvoyltetrahydropterin/6-carboxytetrahydropterin synthase
MALSLTRTVTFHARHRYRKPGWSEAEHQRRFGSAAAEHGHLYRLDVTVTGAPDPETGMVVDLVMLDALIADRILTSLAGQEIGAAVAEFGEGGQLPSCEALAAWCWGRLADRLPDTVRLERVRLAEDETLRADCTGPT